MTRDIFRAIADPTRRAIISLMMMQAMTPNALAEKFDTTRQAVSKHIRVLQECGLLKSRQRGREIYYQLESKKLQEVDRWLEPFRQMWEDRFDNLDRYLINLQKKKPDGNKKQRHP